jgi:hypothetical protein
MIAESTNTIMGVVYHYTDAEIGEVRLLKKVSILKATPKKSGSYNSRKILNGNFSFGNNNNQNNSIALAAMDKTIGIDILRHYVLAMVNVMP